jgi:hypothetical protein
MFKIEFFPSILKRIMLISSIKAEESSLLEKTCPLSLALWRRLGVAFSVFS